MKTNMKINKISNLEWEIPMSEKEGMNTSAKVFATENLLNNMDEGVFEQITNVASLPGIVGSAMVMPDAHWGYGFPIGGVAAFDYKKGIISPGGIGFDIGCGMRLIKTDLLIDEVKPKIKELINMLFKTVPAGVGSKGFVKLDKSNFEEIMVDGIDWCVRNDYAWEKDKDSVEELGKMIGADPNNVSDRAIKRGLKQLGTLGSGNHYLEIQTIRDEEIFDTELAKKLGIYSPKQVFIMIHCGSRGFGHQIASDYLKVFDEAMKKYNYTINDRELSCAPFNSKEGQQYYSAMTCAVNFAFANRQVITNQVRSAFAKVFGNDSESMGMELVYDVSHNVAKVEEHFVNNEKRKLIIHRKGSTRCFGPSSENLPKKYQGIGQPVIVGGSMETGSYLLCGTDLAMQKTFGSTMHGSGRTMSRSEAKKQVKGQELIDKMINEKDIYIKAVSISGVAEEAGIAYKDVDSVVNVMHELGISKKICAFKPIGNVKG